MRISDWSSDVCSSDLFAFSRFRACLTDVLARPVAQVSMGDIILSGGEMGALMLLDACIRLLPGVMGAASRDRKSDVEGKSVSVRVNLGGRRIIKKKNPLNQKHHT